MKTEHIITASTQLAKEGGTFVITASFEDENGNAVTPSTFTWSLVDSDNEIVNSREDIAVTGDDLSSSVDIVLQGDDLPAVENTTYTHLWLVVKGTYTSDAGAGLPFQDQTRFSIEAIKGDT